MQLTKIYQFKYSILVCFLLSSLVTNPISQGTAYCGSIVTGTLVGAPALALPGECKFLSLPLFAVGVAVGYMLLYQFTPIGRMENAERQLNVIASHGLVNRQWVSERGILDAVDNIYITRKWPLIAAFNDLTSYINISFRVHELTNKVVREDHTFAKRAAALNKKADIYADNITTALKTIKTSTEYLDQLGQFEQDRRHQEKMRIQCQQVSVQQKIADAQMINARAQQDIAAAQKQIANTKSGKKAGKSDQNAHWIVNNFVDTGIAQSVGKTVGEILRETI